MKAANTNKVNWMLTEKVKVKENKLNLKTKTSVAKIPDLAIKWLLSSQYLCTFSTLNICTSVFFWRTGCLLARVNSEIRELH